MFDLPTPRITLPHIICRGCNHMVERFALPVAISASKPPRRLNFKCSQCGGRDIVFTIEDCEGKNFVNAKNGMMSSKLVAIWHKDVRTPDPVVEKEYELAAVEKEYELDDYVDDDNGWMSHEDYKRWVLFYDIRSSYSPVERDEDEDEWTSV